MGPLHPAKMGGHTVFESKPNRLCSYVMLGLHIMEDCLYKVWPGHKAANS